MDEKLVITREELPSYLLLHISGRIDGYWSAQLDETLNAALRGGDHNIALDMDNVSYLSSLGIRIFIKYVKQFKSVAGSFGIMNASEGVLSVLKMVGLESQLRWQEPEKKTSEGINRFSYKKEAEGFCFRAHSLSNGEKEEKPLKYTLMGDPLKIRISGYKEEDCKKVRFGKGKYGIGLGAIGAGFEDCKGRFGEFVAIGDAVAYLPSGKNNTPDYMVTKGSLIPEIKMLYGVLFEGEFSRFVRFSPLATNNRLPMSLLIKEIKEITRFESFAFVMVGESSGIVGASLNRSPTATYSATSHRDAYGVKSSDNASRINPFDYPQVKDDINFTTEPEFSGYIALSTGIVTQSKPGVKDNDQDITDSSQDSPDGLCQFTRPSEDGSDILQHIHSAIFNYFPLSKEGIKLEETVNSLFEEGKIVSVLHLLNDQRDTIGVGQSEFLQGVCWVGEINDKNKTTIN